jgi:hypothetical protein
VLQLQPRQPKLQIAQFETSSLRRAKLQVLPYKNSPKTAPTQAIAAKLLAGRSFLGVSAAAASESYPGGSPRAFVPKKKKKKTDVPLSSIEAAAGSRLTRRTSMRNLAPSLLFKNFP